MWKGKSENQLPAYLSGKAQEAMSPSRQSVFITGGTGYLGRSLVPRLLERGHTVRALVRPGSEGKVASGCEAVTGDALNAESFKGYVRRADTFVQLVGVAHPSPAKAAEFRRIDLVAGKAGIRAAAGAGVRHFVYLSVAQPAPMMKSYIAVRAECEAEIRAAGLPATILRPWYVLGPGHRWPYLLVPFYRMMEAFPATREGALRLGLVTLEHMTAALVEAVESPIEGVRTMGVPEIRAAGERFQVRPN
jgi:uncharacterized protein YbjT (DUF2867 family)